MVKRKRSEEALRLRKRLRLPRCYIDALPNEILDDILSRLKLKVREAAAATCLLSRRWTDLWTYSRNLDLDFTTKTYRSSVIRKSVAHVLNKHQGDVDYMRIAFKADNPNPNRLARYFQDWFMIAKAKRVQSLAFEVEECHSEDPYEGHRPFRCFPPWIAMALDSWERLTTVSLKSIVIEGCDLEVLLSKSPNLESLVVQGAPLNALAVGGQTIPKLKRLEIQLCKITSVTINSAPNLEYFKYVPVWTGLYDSISVVLNHCPKLEAIYLGGGFCRFRVFEFLHKLKEHAPRLQKLQLELDMWCLEDRCWKPEHDTAIIPKLENIKQLEMSFCSKEDEYVMARPLAAMAVIQGCPCLEKLRLNYCVQRSGSSDDGADYGLDYGSNECLKEVQVMGWCGTYQETRFIRYLIHSSPNLEHLSLLPNPEEHNLFHRQEVAADFAIGLIGYLQWYKKFGQAGFDF